ncbi:DUF2161 domain-containing phosphodiesterase [Celeribacter sp. PS-C1]|nr:DUF2161 domain-containing phosphodiesterase [Celeribacter sp. PS-C1]
MFLLVLMNAATFGLKYFYSLPEGLKAGGRVTAYRQDAEKGRAYLLEHGPPKGAEVAKATGVKHATRMMWDNHYGWFEKVEVGVYGILV